MAKPSGPYRLQACSCKRETPPEGGVRDGGDAGWWLIHSELGVLHAEKADGYGTEQDALANYVETSQAVGEPDEFTPWLRIHEKCCRALNLIRAGRADECEEGLDVAALAIGAEALRRRRFAAGSD